MSTLYNKRMNLLKERYLKRGKLELSKENENSEIIKNNVPTECQLLKEHLERLKKRFQLSGGLQFENLTVPKNEAISLDEAVRQSEKDEMKNLKLSFGATKYRGAKLNIYFLTRN